MVNIPPSDLANTFGSQKRKNPIEQGVSTSNKKARTRASYSCRECHRRKQKCNRQIPCSHCIARKVPHLCEAYSPGKTEQDLHARISKIEHVLEIALPQYWYPGGSGFHSGDTNSERQRTVSTGPDDEVGSATEEQDPVGGTFQSGAWFGNSASGAIASAFVLRQINTAVASHTISNHDLHGGRPKGYGADNVTSPAQAPVFPVDTSVPGPERSAVDNFQALIQDCGVSPHKISELVQELPPKFLTEDLIDYYFTAINWTRYPIPEPDFRASYASLCSSGPSALPNDVRFLPLLFVVLAISVRFSPERLGGDAKTRRLTSLRYYWSSRRSVLIAAAIQPDCMEIIWTRLLSARFLAFDRRITECWSQLGAAVSTAQSLGLHRDGATMRMEPIQVEHRRRIWAHLYHADRSFALILGRPTAIKDEYTSTQVPLNLDYDLTTQSITNPPPLTTPTPMSFVILRHSLSVIMGSIVHHFQQVQRQSSYSEVGKIDDELLHFMHNLPPHFAVEPDTSLDQTHSYIPAHRFLILTEILFVRITLHRPYLLRRLDSNRYLLSRKACFESALKDFEVRQAFCATVTKEAREAVAIAYREFQAVMISAIYLVLNPRGDDAAAMHVILDTFLRDHDAEREMDETMSREVETIRFLKSKALQMAESSSDAPTLPDAAPNSALSASLSHDSHPETHSLPELQHPAHTRTGESSLDEGTRSPNISYDVPPQSPSILGLRRSPVESPSEDDSAAQSLLDHWCNSVGPGSISDGSTAMAGFPWGASLGADASGWFSTSPIFGMDSQAWDGAGGSRSDLSYWETLVDQIRGLPS